MTETTKGTEAYSPKPPAHDCKRWWVRVKDGIWHWAERSYQNGREDAAKPHETTTKEPQ